MKKEDINPDLYRKILECFLQSIVKNGLKSTTMDSIAASLQMSKRTLYEIFGTKEDLFRTAHSYFHNKMREKLTEIFQNSDNVMEAIIKCFLYNRDLMSHISVDFLKDIQNFSSQDPEWKEARDRSHHQHLIEVIQRGVAEGYFRDDLNLNVLCRMFTLQMESLKRAQEIFPEDISLLEVYDNVIVSFLRGISSNKGLEEMEKFIPLFNSSLSHHSQEIL